MESTVKCSHCSKPAIIELRYAGRTYCKNHFCRMIWKRFKSNVRENNLFEEGQKVGIALSGGKDSVVLTYLLNQIRDHLGLDFHAITVDGGVSVNQKQVLRTTKKICEDLDIEQHVVSFKDNFGKTIDQIAEEKKDVSPCYFYEVFRRYLLNKTARELKLDVLATGHNLDDEAQVILMNLMRGNSGKIFRIGAKVGSKRSDQFVPIVKPLRDIPERELAVYALVKGYPTDFNEDCPYVTRSFEDSLRVHINQLEEEFPGTKIAIVRTFDQLKNSKPSDYPTPKVCPKCGELTLSKVCKTCKILESL
jgi:uncharacterized protein (TIGR00269 family)